ncbi:MAG: hypothetical protein WKF78_13675 [Candidatus Limnocylindrales bacterium]
MLRLTGMDLKMEQYKKGEIFVRSIAEARGPAVLRAPVGRAGHACRVTGRSRRPSAGSRRVLDGLPEPTARPARRRRRRAAGPGVDPAARRRPSP